MNIEINIHEVNEDAWEHFVNKIKGAYLVSNSCFNFVAKDRKLKNEGKSRELRAES